MLGLLQPQGFTGTLTKKENIYIYLLLFITYIALFL